MYTFIASEFLPTERSQRGDSGSSQNPTTCGAQITNDANFKIRTQYYISHNTFGIYNMIPAFDANMATDMRLGTKAYIQHKTQPHNQCQRMFSTVV